MKKLFFLFCILICFSAFKSFTIQSISEIVNAFKSGNSTQLAQFFDNRLDVSILGESHTYNKKEGTEILTNFFNVNPVNNFILIHKSESANAQFFIGNLITKNGNFRTTVYVKMKGKNIVIQEIQFEK